MSKSEIVSVMGEVLNLAETELTDSSDFFAHGGDSISAIRLVVALRRRSGINFPIDTVQLHPTALEMSKFAEELIQAGMREPTDKAPATASSDGQLVQLSGVQMAIYRAISLRDRTCMYNIPLVFRVRGPVDVDRLAEAFRLAGRFHESTRARIVSQDGQKALWADSVGGPLVAALTTPTFYAAVGAARRFLRQQIDVREPCPLRVLIVESRSAGKRGPDQPICHVVITASHLVFDGASLGAYMSTVATIYSGRNAPESPLRSLAAQSDDCGDGMHKDAVTAEWRAEAWSRFAFQIPRADLLDDSGGRISRRISARRLSILHQIARDHKASPYETLVALLHILWSKSNTGTFTLAGAVRQASATAESGIEHCGVSGIKVLRLDGIGGRTLSDAIDNSRLVLRGAMSSSQAFITEDSPTIVVALEDDEIDSFDIAGADVRPLDWGNQTAKFELTIFAHLDRPYPRLVVEYLVQSCCREDVARFVDELLSLLDEAEADYTSGSQGRGSPRAEEHIPCPGTASVGASMSWRQSIVDVFRMMVAAAPAAIAIEDAAGRSMSYAELDNRSSEIAATVRAGGCRPGDVVTIRCPRTAELIAITLGVLKAGCAYMMITPDEPEHRLGPVAGVSTAELMLSGTQQVGFRSNRAANHAVANDFPPGMSVVRASWPACVMLTSGTSGVPHAVVSSHRALVETVCGQEFARFSIGTRMLHYSAMSWDVYALETWGPLLNGGTCVLASSDIFDLAGLAFELENREIDIAWMTSGVLTEMAKFHPSSFAGIRCLMTGGERVRSSAVRGIRHFCSGVIINGYGPVEATIFASTHYFPAKSEIKVDAEAPIGRPIRETSMYILDAGLRQARPESVGEIAIATPRLAYGYLGDARATAAKFVPCPWDNPGSRMYLTGDLGRVSDDVLYFVGRSDRQLKVDGYRVDLDEVEAKLTQAAGAESYSLAYEANGRTRIIGVLPGPVADVAEIAGRIARELPQYARPADLVVIDGIPRSPNGKADRRELRRLIQEDLESRMTTPRIEVDQLLSSLTINIASEELGHVVDGDTSVVREGGSSLVAARIAARLSSLLRTEVSVTHLLRGSSLNDFARELSRKNADSSFANRVRAADQFQHMPADVREELAKIMQDEVGRD